MRCAGAYVRGEASLVSTKGASNTCLCFSKQLAANAYRPDAKTITLLPITLYAAIHGFEILVAEHIPTNSPTMTNTHCSPIT